LATANSSAPRATSLRGAVSPRASTPRRQRRDNGISRQGDIRLRKLFALGASTIMRYARVHADHATLWQRGILARRPVKIVVLAQAAKTARIAWTMLVSGDPYRKPSRGACG
jgi:transposase